MANVARRKQNMPARVINAELKRKGYTQERLAAEIERGRSTVSEVISGATKSAYIAEAVARVLGKTPSEIWPRLYPVSDIPQAS